MTYMASNAQRQVSFKIIKAVIKNRRGIKLDTWEINDQLIGFVKPLVIQDEDDETVEAYWVEEEQESICKVIQLVESKDLQLYYDLLMVWKKMIVQGGETRMKFTIPGFIFQLFKYIYTLDGAMT